MAENSGCQCVADEFDTIRLAPEGLQITKRFYPQITTDYHRLRESGSLAPMIQFWKFAGFEPRIP
jgi:hypothetical protein